MIKRLLQIAILCLLVACAGALWFHQSVYYSMLEIRDGISNGDVEKVKKHVDLPKVAVSAATFFRKKATNDLGGFVGGLADLAADALKAATGTEVEEVLADGMNAGILEKIRKGDVFDMLGNFEPLQGLEGLGEVVDGKDGQKIVTVRGRCDESEANISVIFDRVQAGPLGLLGYYRAVGATSSSLDQLAKVCKIGPL